MDQGGSEFDICDENRRTTAAVEIVKAEELDNDVSPKQQMTSSTSECELLQQGQIIRERWKIRCKIGGGGFGEIYEAVDAQNPNELVAIKVESSKANKQVLKMEVAVLRKLQGKKHACKFYGCGRNEKFNYLIMTLQGRNLADLRRETPKQIFSVSTSIRLGLQILEAIEDIHSIGFLHRDIKPSNFSIGRLSNNAKNIYMLDFGLARQFVNSKGELRSPRRTAGFRGTVRYASLTAHKNKEMGRQDDLWSLFYMLVEFMHGSLPWRKTKEKDEVGKMKEHITVKKLLEGLPQDLHEYVAHLQTLEYNDIPNYKLLADCFYKILTVNQVKLNDPFDWELTYDRQGKLKVPNPSLSKKSATVAQRDKGATDNKESTQISFTNGEPDGEDAFFSSKKKERAPNQANGRPKYKRPEFMRPKVGSFNLEIIDVVQARLARASESDSEHDNSNHRKRSSLSVGRLKQPRRIVHAPSLNEVSNESGGLQDFLQLKEGPNDCNGSSDLLINRCIRSSNRKNHRSLQRLNQTTEVTASQLALADDDGVSLQQKHGMTMVSKWHGSFDESLDEENLLGDKIFNDTYAAITPRPYVQPLGPLNHSRSIDLTVIGRNIYGHNEDKSPTKGRVMVPPLDLEDRKQETFSPCNEKIPCSTDSSNECQHKSLKTNSNPFLNHLKNIRSSFHGLLPGVRSGTTNKNGNGLKSDKSGKMERFRKIRTKSAEYLKLHELNGGDQEQFRRQSDCNEFSGVTQMHCYDNETVKEQCRNECLTPVQSNGINGALSQQTNCTNNVLAPHR